MAYASILMEPPGRMREQTAYYREKGFRAIKIGWGPFGRVSARLDEEIVRAAREGAGDDCLLMVDAGGSDAFWPNGLNWAVNAAAMLHDHNVAWFEEALRPDAIDDFKALRERSRVPVATGECITRRQNFLPWFERRAIDIVQPDVTKVGGLSDQIQIARMANAFGVNISGTAGTRRSGSPPTCNSLPRFRPQTWSNISAARPMWTRSRSAALASTQTA